MCVCFVIQLWFIGYFFVFRENPGRGNYGNHFRERASLERHSILYILSRLFFVGFCKETQIKWSHGSSIVFWSSTFIYRLFFILFFFSYVFWVVIWRFQIIFDTFWHRELIHVIPWNEFEYHESEKAKFEGFFFRRKEDKLTCTYAADFELFWL